MRDLPILKLIYLFKKGGFTAGFSKDLPEGVHPSSLGECDLMSYFCRADKTCLGASSVRGSLMKKTLRLLEKQ